MKNLKKHRAHLPAIFKAALILGLMASLTQLYHSNEEVKLLEVQVEQLEHEKADLVVSKSTLESEVDSLNISLYGSEVKKNYAMDVALQVDGIFKRLRDGSVMLAETVTNNCNYDTRGNFLNEYNESMDMMIEAAEDYNKLIDSIEETVEQGL